MSLERSGFVDIDCGYDGAGIGCLVMPFLLGGCVVVHLVIFRGGWTTHISVLVGDEVRATRKIRYRSKAAALADLDHQRELAAELPLEPPCSSGTRRVLRRRR